MTQEIKLKEQINAHLASLGYHLRVSTIKIGKSDYAFDYVPPIDKWAKELLEVDDIIQNKIEEYVLNRASDDFLQ
jgi:hypothetical protein